MAKTETLNLEVKSNIKSVTKDTDKLADSVESVKDEAKDAVGEFTFMGVSLNGVKTAMGKVIPMAKAMFGSIKAGLISTGIGVFVVAIGSLVASFTRTKKGAEALETAFTTVGTAVSVVLDRIGGLGNAIALFFQGKWTEAAAAAKAAISGIGVEIVAETTAMIALTKASQKLADAQRNLNVETAQAVADIEKLKLVAEDITKSYKEREEAANSAFAKETELENKRIELAAEAVRIEQERHILMGKDGVMAEDLDALAELEINLANIKQESAGRQISLQNFLNGLRETEKAQQDAIFDKKIADNDAWNQAQLDGLDTVTKATEAANEKRLSSEKKSLDDKKKIEDAKMAMNISIANQGLQIIAEAAGEGTALAKAAAIAQATISGVQGVQNAFTAANANIGATAGSFGAYPVTMAALAGTFAAMNIAKIASGGKPGGGGGGGGAVSPSIPSPQMMSGAFELTGATEPEPVQAFVVSDDITNSQNSLAIIRRRATI